ncbi:MAG TPA: hypothetical protein EYG68_07445 [Leucothrix mucor]|nr:hypothetical protein [Leucothrix mucor]
MIVHKKKYKQISLRRYSSEKLVRWKNFLVAKTDALRFSLDDDDNSSYQISIRSDLPEIRDKSLGLLVEIEGIPAALWISTWPLIERIRIYITENKLKNLPLELRAELLETALDPLLSSLMSKLDVSIKVLNFFKIKPSDINEYSVAFKVVENQTRDIDAILILNNKLQPVIEKLISRWPSFYYSPDWNNHVTPVWLEVGSMTLAVAELEEIEAADVILIDTVENIRNQKVCLRLISGERFKANIDNKILTIESGIKRMSNDNENDVAKVGDLPVKLTFDIGDMELPFHEVESLTAGYIINLQESFSEVVKIRSQNRVIGTGELVDINGKVGVRVISLFGMRTDG